MNKRTAERFALVALVGLVAYGLACMFPVAWSPDSERLVFPVFREEMTVARLVMTNLKGDVIREIDRGEDENTQLSVASWSPDGRCIAYLKFQQRPAPAEAGAESQKKPETAPALMSLIVQDAETGAGRVILKEEISPTGRQENVIQANAALGVQWTPDSKQVLLRRAVGESVQLALVNAQSGKVERSLETQGEQGLQIARLSPDGRSLAYAKEVKVEDQPVVQVRILDLESATSRSICSLAGKQFEEEMPALAWAHDGRGIYIGCTAEEEPVGKVELIGLDGARKVVWQKRQASPIGLSVAAKSGLLAIDYGLETGRKKNEKEKSGFGPDINLFFGIDVVDPESGRACPIHFGELHLSTSISPDGKWVALCLPAAFEEAEEGGMVGAIVSADGSEVRFFLPNEDMKAAVPQVLRYRLEGAVRASGVTEELPILEKPKEATVEQAQEAVASAERMLLELDAPIFREAAAYGKVAFYLAVLKQKPVDEREAFAADARAQLDAFRRACPEHRLIADLESELEALLTEKPVRVEPQ